MQGAAAVAQKLQALSLMPIFALAEGRDQSVPSLLRDMTGLSKARIAKGNLDAVRPSTKAKMDQHLEHMLVQQFQNNPEGLKELRNKIAVAPNTASGSPAVLASWMHQFEFLPAIPLPTTKAVALTIDELLEALLAACGAGDLQRFKQILQAHFQHHGAAVRVCDAPMADPVAAEEMLILQGLADWDEAAKWVGKVIDHLYLDLIAALDAEWCSHYFAGRQAKPLFPLVMVRLQEGLEESLKIKSRRNIHFKPSRRLLEILYALAFRMRRKKWPASAPTPKTLAQILYRPDKEELTDESLVSNYFDGTTALTMDLALAHWTQLLEYFFDGGSEAQMIGPPLPMIVLALKWQNMLVLDKGKSFLIPNQKNYHELWRHRRQQWEAEQAKRDEQECRTGRPKGEPIDWPAWSFNQSSSSS